MVKNGGNHNDSRQTSAQKHNGGRLIETFDFGTLPLSIWIVGMLYD